MIREYQESHSFNRTIRSKNPITGKSVIFVRGVIRCDGKDVFFVGYGRNTKEAQDRFDSFLDQDCICVREKAEKTCPIHKEGPA